MVEKPRIPCKNCGTENHFVTASNAHENQPGTCRSCGSYIRAPTQEEREQYAQYLKER